MKDSFTQYVIADFEWMNVHDAALSGLQSPKADLSSWLTHVLSPGFKASVNRAAHLCLYR